MFAAVILTAAEDEAPKKPEAKNSGVQHHPSCGLTLLKKDDVVISAGVEAEGGLWYDKGLYASFGLEGQIFRLSKVVLPVSVRAESRVPGHFWTALIEPALLYDSLRHENHDPKIYGPDSKGRPLDGAAIYQDWYKNLGSRLYVLGGVPLREAYFSYHTAYHQIDAGRLKNFISFDEAEVPWGDDAKMAPRGYWLSKDLLSGVRYLLSWQDIQFRAGVFSGANPVKSGAGYLGGVQSPNIKANNTGTYAAALAYAPKFSVREGALKTKAFAGYQYARAGSTWSDALQDGKRLASVGSAGFKVCFVRGDHRWIQQVKLFGQYTWFLNGLDPKSAQNNGHPRFKKFVQQGFFVGGQLGFAHDFSVWAAFERMGRYDADLWVLSGFNPDDPLRDSVQKSLIVGARWAISRAVDVQIAYHRLQNPAPWASQVWDEKGQNRLKAGCRVQF